MQCIKEVAIVIVTINQNYKCRFIIQKLIDSTSSCAYQICTSHLNNYLLSKFFEIKVVRLIFEKFIIANIKKS